jgi:hypothetical protein
LTISVDAKGVGLTSIPSVYGYLQRASAISQNYYPERLGKLYIINAPWGFSGAFSVIKKFLDPVTVAKIHVLGSGFEKELTAQIPKENLPKRFGGTCACSGGCEFSDEGPWRDPQFAKPAKSAEQPAAPPSDTTTLATDQPSMSASSGVPDTSTA